MSMLSVEYDDQACVVTVSGRPTALRALAYRLELLAAQAEAGIVEQAHLYSEEWGGSELAVEAAHATASGVVVHHVRLRGLPA